MRKGVILAAVMLALLAPQAAAQERDWWTTRTFSGCRIIHYLNDPIRRDRLSVLEWSGGCDAHNFINGPGTLVVMYTNPPRRQRLTMTFTADGGLVNGAVQVSLHSQYPTGWRPDVYPEVRTNRYRNGCNVEDLSCVPASGLEARQGFRAGAPG